MISICAQNNDYVSYCDDAYQCVNSTIKYLSVYCDGFYSCTKSTLRASLLDLYCQGAYSCNQAKNLTSGSGSSVYCEAAASCAMIKHFESGATVWCDGANACMNSNIMWTTPANLRCGGEYSCANSNITVTNFLVLYASYSGVNAQIHSGSNYNRVNTITGDSIDKNESNYNYDILVWLYGFQAGFNASIYCHNQDNCTFLCYGNACEHTNILCDDINRCTVYCHGNERLCPQINNYSRSSTSTSLISTLSDVDLNINDSSLLLIPKLEQICTSLMTNNNTNNHTISCHDYGQCGYQYRNNVNILCCTATYSCYRNRIGFGVDGDDETLIANINDNYNVAICMASFSCRYSRFIFDNDTSIYSKAGQVFCYGYSSCSRNLISHADKVYCGGDTSCSEAVLNNNSLVVCSGDSACESTDIIGTMIIYGTAYDSLTYANITMTKDNSIVYLLARHTMYPGNILCKDGTVCHIICAVEGACDFINLQCQGVCNVECSEFDDNCTSTYNYTIIKTTNSNSSSNGNNNNNDDNDDKKENWWISTISFLTIDQYVLATSLVLFLFVIIFGTIDGKFWRENELFSWTSVGFFVAYTTDFISGSVVFLRILFFVLFFFFSFCFCSMGDTCKKNRRVKLRLKHLHCT